jgi:hypothetical protein
MPRKSKQLKALLYQQESNQMHMADKLRAIDALEDQLLTLRNSLSHMIGVDVTLARAIQELMEG